MAGLDALRALAVTLVVVYHLVPASLPGGYIGVDVFFVLSGFLITTILLREHARTGRVSLRRFWLHRARRLLPALAAVLVVGLASVAVAVSALQIRGELVEGSVWGDLLVGAGAQVAAAATFTSNWVTVALGQSYAAASAPHLFENLWSLAVEEQFYVLWPLAVMAALGLGIVARRASAGAAAVAAASALTMAALLPADGDATRVYMGTDTHAFGLMIGAALAFWWAADDARGAPQAHPARATTLGITGLLSLGALAAFLPWDSTWTYRGGLLLASLAAAAAIHMVVAVPAIGRALDTGPARWVAARSYGLYLWHWPVLVVLATAFDGGRVRDASLLTVALTLALTVGAATASYRWIETPVRRMGFRRAGRAMLGWLYPVAPDGAVRRRVRRRRVALVGGAGAGLLALACAAIAAAPARTGLEMQLDAGAAIAAGGDAPSGPALPTPDATPSDVPTPGTGASSPLAHGEPPLPARVPPPGALPARAPDGDQVTMVGDSVALGSAPALADAMPGIAVDAEVGRQFAAGVDVVERLARKGRLRPYVVVALGTNGAVPDEDMERLIRLAGDRRVVLVTPYGDRSWMPDSQRAVRRAAGAHDNVVVADWQRAVEEDPSVLGPDGIHPDVDGQETFVEVVETGLAEASEEPAGTDPDATTAGAGDPRPAVEGGYFTNGMTSGIR
nr:acyltransferase family protein [Demequina soli]